MKFTVSILLAIALLTTPCRALTTLTDEDIPITAPAACLMEQHTGAVIYEKDAHTPRHIASVTKVMTLLLIMEAIAGGQLAWTDTVTASKKAASMGGSQIWLEEGETMTAEEMVKCITVVSANDCSVAMAEHLCGTEEAFVKRMNERAAELGMENTHFTNCTGLFDKDDHKSSAYDIALMARSLIGHEAIKRFSTVWMDTARDGEFGLSNTNRLIHSFQGATGLKTGFTNEAKYCLAATAEREGDAYIAVVLGADTSADRFDSAATLLSFAFAGYTLRDLTEMLPLPSIPVTLGKSNRVQPVYGEETKTLLEKSEAGLLKCVPSLPSDLEAPIAAGQQIGTVQVYLGDTMLTELPVIAAEDVPRMSVWDIWKLMFRMR